MKFRATNEEVPAWTFLTNHAHVLLCIAKEPTIRLVDIALMVGIGERAVHSIVTDLIDAGYIVRHKQGRNNVYEVNLDQPFRHPLEADHQVADIFKPFTGKSRQRR